MEVLPLCTKVKLFTSITRAIHDPQLLAKSFGLLRASTAGVKSRLEEKGFQAVPSSPILFRAALLHLDIFEKECG
jgi:hypothetical protein